MFFLRILLALSLSHAKTNVFVVPHSHNDAGWLETISDYYLYSVKHTLNNIFLQLQRRPAFKFCWSEILFLSMWLEEYPEHKEELKVLIKQGRFEIIGGGWVQNDEALPDFESVLRQHEIGFNYIKKELDLKEIKVGWQLDPFGHSSLTAALFEKMGIESIFFARIDYRVKSYLEFSGNSEFIWRGEGFGSEKGIFTHVLNDHYTYPKITDPDHHSRCFNSLPIKKDEIARCVNDLELYVNTTKNHYKTENYLIVIGTDFAYTSEFFTFEYLDFWELLINSTTSLNIKFATPSEYLSSVKSTKTKLPLYEGDLLPLISGGYGTSYSDYKKVWTGYYSTKPYLKKLIYDVQKSARIAEFFVSKILNQEFFAKALSSTMHHDAITGTCKHHVYLDYIELLKEEKKKIFALLGEAFNEHLKPNFQGALIKQYKIVYLVNPVNWPIRKTVCFVVNWKNVKLIKSEGGEVEIQVVPYKDKYRVFLYQELKGFEVKVLFVEEHSKLEEKEIKETNEETFSNWLITVNMKDGLLNSVNKDGNTHKLKTKLFNYGTDNSGPYTFLPMTPPSLLNIKHEYKVFKGKVVTLAQTLFFYDDQIFTQQVFIDSHSSNIQLTFDIHTKKNNEIFMRFEYPHDHSGWFYLFNSGNVMRKFFQYETINTRGLNYFPINGGVLIDLKSEFLHIFPGFPLGAGMPDPEHYELNLFRHPDKDDQLGIGEYSPDEFSVEHSWTFTFQAFSPSGLWKSYIEAKTSPEFYFRQSNLDLTENYEKGDFFNTPVTILNVNPIMPEDTCNYFSSLLHRNGEKILQVMNLCEESKDLKGFSIIEERNAGGLPKTSYESWLIDGNIEFWLGNSTGANVIKYPISKSSVGIPPFHLKTYVVQSQPSITFTISTKASEVSFFLLLFLTCSTMLFCLFIPRSLTSKKIVNIED